MSARTLAPAFTLTSDCRGIFVRVAKRIEVDPSMVSRVAREQRKSKTVEVALRQEIRKILDSIGVSIKNETEFWRQ